MRLVTGSVATVPANTVTLTVAKGRSSELASRRLPNAQCRDDNPRAARSTYDASEGQRSTSLPETWAEVTFPCESSVALPWPLRYQIPGSPVMGLGKKGP